MNTAKGKLEFYKDNPDQPRHISRFAERMNSRQEPDKFSNTQKSTNKLRIA
jgi:hypothetical protein